MRNLSLFPRRLLFLVIPAILLTSLPSSAEIIPFDSDRWVLFNAEIVDHLDRQALIGSAYLPNVGFENGIIEFDVATDGRRGYPGIRFRVRSQLECEKFYFRPHVPDRPDALQYTPMFAGVAGWQLYSGPGFTAAAPIPTDEWIHVRVEIMGQRARVYFGDGEEPALEIHDLKHETVAGPVVIESARNLGACFANFSVTKSDDLDFGPERNPVHPRGLVTDWDLSQPLRATDADAEIYPDADLLASLEWKTVPTEPNGLLDIVRHATRSLNGETDLIYAKTTLVAEEDETRKFTFGYSDLVTVFLNGEIMFTGNSAYRSRDETFSGIVGLFDSLHLPLAAGENELMFCVVENFGGWGLMGQDNSADFLAPGVESAWTLPTGNRVPESALYDPERELIYVTQYFRGGNEFISRLGLDGEYLDFEWVSGLQRPTGLCLHDGFLWVVDRQHLVQVDPDNGEILDKRILPEPGFPNDVAFDAGGTAYVSDTRRHLIYRCDTDTCVVWHEGDSISQPNGLLMDGDRLLFGNQGDGCLKAVSLDDGSVATVACFGDDSNVDGIRPDGKGGWIVSDFNGRIFQVTGEGEVQELVNTTASGAFAADLDYIPEMGLMVVPGLYDNRLSAYRMGFE